MNKTNRVALCAVLPCPLPNRATHSFSPFASSALLMPTRAWLTA